MNSGQNRQTWAIARLLFATHLPMMLLLWMIFAAIVVVVIIVLAFFTSITWSVWDGATQVLRWLALGYGIYLVRQLLPVYIAHGQTRRDFMLQASVFLLAGLAVFAMLITFGYMLEAWLYQFMGWLHGLPAQRLFTSANQLPLIFFSCLALFVGWTAGGLLLGAGSYRSDEAALFAIPIALVMITLIGAAFGVGGLPFVGRFVEGLDIPMAITAPLCLGTFLLGLVMTWSFIRDIPIRKKAT